ncbi:MAG: hypothetical protein HY716_09025 [Planctomycetes bacterium]|nr:hypothetical protein [Planctomycetota bacterium]
MAQKRWIAHFGMMAVATATLLAAFLLHGSHESPVASRAAFEAPDSLGPTAQSIPDSIRERETAAKADPVREVESAAPTRPPAALADSAGSGTRHRDEPLNRHHPQVARAIEIQERYSQWFMSHEAVVGHAVGLNDRNRIALVVYTKGDVHDIPENLEGFPVVVRHMGEVVALKRVATQDAAPRRQAGKGKPGADPTARQTRPVPIGVSTGHPSITAGTIGCRVTDGTDVFALSNNHVYADSNQADIGDPVIQPGTYDGGVSPDDDIGILSDYEPIVFSTQASNVMDAAIALSDASFLGNATLSDGYGTPQSTTLEPAISMHVKKYGRTTGLTKGKIVAIHATVNIGYGDQQVARFVNQIVIDPPPASDGGDSGSLIVFDGKGPSRGDDRKPVGLLFAGSFFYTIANPIDPILERFGVTIDGD